MQPGTLPPLLVAVFLAALPLRLYAQFTYTTNAGAITITGYTGTGGDLTIPSSIEGLPVTQISAQAFANRTSLTSVTIPDSVTFIEPGYYFVADGRIKLFMSGAFQGCSGLTNLTLGNGVNGIGEYTFSGCTGLTSVTIPNSARKIGSLAFASCQPPNQCCNWRRRHQHLGRSV